MPVISAVGTLVLLAMSPPRVCLRRHGDTDRDPGVTTRRGSAGGASCHRSTAVPGRCCSGWPDRRRPREVLGLLAPCPTVGRCRQATPPPVAIQGLARHAGPEHHAGGGGMTP